MFKAIKLIFITLFLLPITLLAQGTSVKGSHVFVEASTGKIELQTRAAQPIYISPNNTRAIACNSDGTTTFLSGIRVASSTSDIDSDITSDAGTAIKLYVQGNSGIADEIALVDTGNDAGGFNINVYSTNATSANANTIVASGKTAFSLTAKGANGSTYTNGARMSAVVSATPGAADMPMDWVLYNTPDGTATLAETFRITSEGVVKAAKGNVEMSTGGTTIAIQEGTAASACMGNAAANGATGTVVSTTCVKTTSRIFISRTSAPSGTADCWASPSDIVNNTSFVLDCSGAETGTFNWMIVQEAS